METTNKTTAAAKKSAATPSWQIPRPCTSCGVILDASNYARGNVCDGCREP